MRHSGARAAGALLAGPTHLMMMEYPGLTPVDANNSARRLLDALLASPAAAHFKVLPDPILYPNYYVVIARPVCLADMSARVNSAARYTLADMVRDVRRMLTNAKRYNMPDSQVYQDALLLEVCAQCRCNRMAALGDLPVHVGL